MATDSRASGFYEDALTRFEKKDYPGAIIQLKNAVKLDKRNLSVQVLLGKSLLANGEVAAAEVAFNEALNLGVNRAEVVLPLGNAVIAQGRPRELLDQPQFALQGLPTGVQAQLLLLRAGATGDVGDVKGALKAIDDARALDPQLADAWVAEVPIRIRARQFKEALAAADKALSMSPDMADALYARGSVLHVQGDRAGALAAYDRALKVQAVNTEALVSRAGLLLDSGRNADAERDVAELLRSSPRDPRGQYLRALLADAKGDTNGARVALNEVTAMLDPLPLEFMRYRPQIMMLGGLAHYGLNQKEKAQPYLEGVQRQQPQSPVSKLLAQIYLGQNNLDRAIASLEGYLRGQPNDSQALQLLASAHMSQGRHARATQLIQESMRRGNDRPGMQALLGLSLVGGGKAGDAMTELEAAVRKDPGQIQAATALATLYMQNKQSANALRVADGLLKQQPKNPGVLNVVGLVKASAGDIAGARAMFEQTIQLDAAFAAPQVNLARMDRLSRAPDKAATRMATLLKTEPTNVEAMSEIGLALEQQGQLAEAQRWLEKAADGSGPQVLEPSLALVEFHLRQQQPEPAREAAKRLSLKAPEDVRVLMMQARVSLANNDAAAARSGLSRAAGAASYEVHLLMQIALLQLQADHVPGAAHSIDKALAVQPEHLAAQALMTDIEIRQGETAKAEKRARQILAKYPKLGLGYALLGDVAKAKRDMPGALENYRRAHQADQSSESLLRLYAAQGAADPAAAQKLAEQWLKGHPRDAVVPRVLAGQYAQAGNFAAAREMYQRQLKLTPDDAESLNNLANVLILLGDHPEALKAAQAAQQLEPRRPHIVGTLGWASFKNGQSDRALQLLRDARLRDPANSDTRYFLSAVLVSMGRKGEAREELEAALRGGNRNFASAREAQSLLASLK